MKTHNRYSQEVRERAVRMVFDHGREYDSQWSAIVSISSKIGCTAETLRRWVRRAEIDTGRRVSMIALMAPPIFAVMEPVERGEKGSLGPPFNQAI